eukprot:TRINITY_DN5623_c0_g1_i8.p1 TRINITY_DN5623_c0_g1~~TRINITY_DN5623_c0_g1_i8.p1  ORF type:complete len:131 (+),score=16.13 TRINITY_DN5623_c0_g1_i8:416-808(+)
MRDIRRRQRLEETSSRSSSRENSVQKKREQEVLHQLADLRANAPTNKPKTQRLPPMSSQSIPPEYYWNIPNLAAPQFNFQLPPPNFALPSNPCYFAAPHGLLTCNIQEMAGTALPVNILQMYKGELSNRR